MLTDARLQSLADRLSGVPGVVGVTLGGSRARGTHAADSDVDLGLYYRGALDIVALGELARQVAGPAARVTRSGEWGPWVDGGGWLHIDGIAVDWIYRDLERVTGVWADAQQGRFAFHNQVGHPLGFADFAYPGELALGRILADPSGELTRLRTTMQAYPPPLRDAVVTRTLWEAGFLVDIAAKALTRADTFYVAGCLFRALGLCAHALHAHAGRWLINEKGSIDAAGALAAAPTDFADRASGILAGLSRNPAQLRATLDAAGRLVDDARRACDWESPEQR
ncbi:MAG TPA: nucleotidyltransferase domain-containing protein [Jatrophihabitans sp.]|nr:nucleotidyltransferase domain-containing protein [Jatrophihabitans sp.]